MISRSFNNDAFWAMCVQGLVFIGGFPVALVLGSKLIAVSLAFGWAVCVFPNLYFYHRVFRFFGAQSVKKIVKAFYWAEAIKIVMTGILFFVAIKISWVLVPCVFFGFFVTQTAFWFAPLLISIVKVAKQRNLFL